MGFIRDLISALEPEVKVKFSLLNTGATAPKRATDHSAGFDLVSTRRTKKYSLDGRCIRYIEYGFDIAVEIPKGYVGKIYPRSSVSNYDLMLKNCVGVIDSDYRGEITARFQPLTIGELGDFYESGDRICQIIIEKLPKVKFEQVKVLSKTKRGKGGYGSTGKK